MKILSRLLLLGLSLLLVTSCGVDPRWGPPRTGLRQNMAWQYTSQGTITPPAFQSAQPITSTQTAYPIPSAPMQLPQAVQGKVQLNGKHATAPADAPDVIKRAVAAGNRLQDKGYRFGGGHAVLDDTAFDCSGSVSYVLREAGLIASQMPSRGFLNYGEAGEGKWITIWAKDGHVFMTIGGLRLDTGGNGGGEGPRWRSTARKKDGFIPRHPPGL